MFDAKATTGKSAERACHRLVRLRVLDRVADLVRGDRRRRDRPAVIDGSGEEELPLARVVVVREWATARALDGDPVQAVAIEDLPRHLRAGEPVRNRDRHLLGDGFLEPTLNREPEQKRRDEEDEVEPEAAHVRIPG